MDHKVIGEQLYQERVRQHLTLKDVESRTHLPDSLISLVERGKRRNVALNTVLRIARALGISQLSTGLDDEIVVEFEEDSAKS